MRSNLVGISATILLLLATLLLAHSKGFAQGKIASHHTLVYDGEYAFAIYSAFCTESHEEVNLIASYSVLFYEGQNVWAIPGDPYTAIVDYVPTAVRCVVGYTPPVSEAQLIVPLIYAAGDVPDIYRGEILPKGEPTFFQWNTVENGYLQQGDTLVGKWMYGTQCLEPTSFGSPMIIVPHEPTWAPPVTRTRSQ